MACWSIVGPLLLRRVIATVAPDLACLDISPRSRSMDALMKVQSYLVSQHNTAAGTWLTCLCMSITGTRAFSGSRGRCFISDARLVQNDWYFMNF